jgi:hypothetical protein
MTAGPEGDPGGVDATDLLTMTNAALDRLFRSSPAGDIPVGACRGTAILFPGTGIARLLARLVYALAWQGKDFDVRGRQLFNLLSPLRVRAVRARVSRAPSGVDRAPCIVLDYSSTSWIARPVRDEIRLVGPGTYLGVMWLWRRRTAWFALESPDRPKGSWQWQ